MNQAFRLRVSCSRALLIIIAAYLCLGNLPRLFPLPGFKDSLAITEFLVYMAVPLLAMMSGRALAPLKSIYPILVIIGVSFAWGVFLNGFELKPFMYAVRLGLQLWCATIAGRILYHVYQEDSRRVYRFFLAIYAFLLASGSLIFAAFPRSDALWAFLGRFGVTFMGDPHINRFYSTYFDPNYYSVIAIIPVMLAIHLFQASKRQVYAIVAVLFLVSIFLTGSRSGIVSTAVFLLLVFSPSLLKARSLKVSKAVARSVGGAAFVILLLSPLYFNSIVRFLGRMTGIQHDPSAMQRLISFNDGLEVAASHPVLGVGFNYLSYLPVDASLLFLVANFGIVLTWFLAMLGGVWGFNLARKLPNLDRTLPHDGILVRYFFVYLGICIGFASMFNNLLFYQFWLFPMVMLGVYLTQLASGPKEPVHHASEG